MTCTRKVLRAWRTRQTNCYLRIGCWALRWGVPMAKQPARFGEFERRAQDLVQSPDRLQKVIAQAVKKLGSSGGDKLAELKSQLKLLIALLKAWLAGDYRDVSNKTIVIIVAAVLYFVVPLDAIPDFLFGIGLLDDVAVVGI